MTGDRDAGSIRDTSFRLILLLGAISLCGDFISNGARSVTGPYLELLGAGAAVVGLVGGLGEFIGYALRLATGVYADRSRHYWTMTLVGYGLLAVIPFLALAGQWEVAALLIILERIGKAIRTPARDTILSHATSSVGRGRGFGIHKALDQFGAILGPLTFAAVLLAGAGYTGGFLVLVIPLAFMFATLFAARAAVPKPRGLEVVQEKNGPETADLPALLPYATFIFLGMAGFASFPLISYHFVAGQVIPDVDIPILYAIAMTVSVLVALVIGRVYDRFGYRTLIAIPIINSLIPFFAFSLEFQAVLFGALLWGLGIGIYETVFRATIADVTAVGMRGQAYGFLNAAFGTALFLGSVVMGVLYEVSIVHIIVYVLIVEVLALAAFFWMIAAAGSRGEGV
ncbi:MAG: MFS transporter [Methanomicrobiaceae archaeon]|nr:MFS transporter [Methanomicrobiaceae archaeon]MDD5419770.1 MFS transporter [Methanomicrobiaceae archaeon]